MSGATDGKAASSAPAVATDELSLLDRVFLRLASASTDEELTSVVAKCLPSCLLKLNSATEGVRKKVLELLVHVNKRVKDNQNIQLPVEALLLQYQDPSATTFVTNFTIIYIKMGFSRLTLAKQAQLVPSVLACLDGKPAAQQDSLLLMIMPVLGEVVSPSEDPEKKLVLLGINDKPDVANLFQSFILDFLLLPYGSHPSQPRPSPGAAEGPPGAAKPGPLVPPPGMSETSWKRVAGEAPGAKPEVLEKRKCSVVKFLGSGFMSEMQVALQLLVALADTRHSVVAVADGAVRRLSGHIDWENQALVANLYRLFLGTLVVKDKAGKTSSPEAKPENRKTPANTRIRLKLMPYLLRSREAAIQFPASIQVTFDLLFGTTGNSNAKLKSMAIEFVHSIVQVCPASRLTAIGPVLLSALTKMVNQTPASATAAATPTDTREGGGTENTSFAAKEVVSKQRASCYVAIGKLGAKVPALINKDMTVVQTFFEAMSTEDKETQISVQEALSLMASSCKQMASNNLQMLEAMLATYIDNEHAQVRLMALQYAGQVFMPNHVSSRFILLIGAGDIKEEVANGAKGHLYGPLKKANASKENATVVKTNAAAMTCVLPEFLPMMKFVLDKSASKMKSSRNRVEIGGVVLPFRAEVYAEMLNFLRVCLINSAGPLPYLEALRNPLEFAPKVTSFLQANDSVVVKFLEFAERLMKATQGEAQAQCLLQVAGCSPDIGAKFFREKLSWIKALLNNTREDIRECVAHLFGVVASGLSLRDFELAVQDLLRSFKEKQVEFQHGAIVAVGYSFGRVVRGHRKGNVAAADWTTYKDTVNLVIDQLSSQQALSMSAGCLALAEMGRNGALPLPAKSDENASSGSSSQNHSKQSLVEKLLSVMKNGKVNMKIRERAALSAGQLSVGEPDFPLRDDVVKGFLELMQDIKEVELHLTMGEAIVHAVLGPLSPIARDLWSVDEADFVSDHGDPSVSDKQLNWVLDQLTTKYMWSTHPNVKQASCIFLLAILQHGQKHNVVKGRLAEIQGAFMGLLGDANDLVQDAASKGLGIVYEACSEEQRDAMVDNLLKTLLEGQRKVQKVDKDSKIFEEGQLGKAPSGENLTTYKELCSLASDLNQPDLVYKFMNLANHNAIWNSRRGAAFGFGTIAAKAGEQLEPHLNKIIPKLYRYQFDPSPKIQQSMQSIWNALVSDSSKTLDKYLAEILEDLRINLTSNQWRVRESCCEALQDLLRGRTLETAFEVLPSLWADLFRVMDDIKESVRIAAAKTVAALSRNCIRMCDVTQSGAKAGEKAIEVILPVLLDKGLMSNVNEVKAAALNVIVKITKSAGILLKPHLALLIPALLEATGELEGTQVGYLSSRLANDAGVQEKLDMARIAAARSSPLMDCVNYVIQFVDDEVLSGLVPRLVDMIKANVGLGTKGSAAHVVTNLTHQCPLQLQPYTSKLLAAFFAGLSDRNPAVRKTYASAIGQLLKTAKDKSVEKLFVKLRTWYMDKDDEASRWAVAFTYQAITRHNPDKMKEYASEALPIAFLAMHEETTAEGGNKESLETWEEVWSEGTPGTEGGIRMYLTEIVSLLSVAIESPQWKVKAQAARAIGKIAQKLGKNVPENDQKKLLAMLLNGLAGRTWTGKEALLTALSDMCVHGDVRQMLDPERQDPESNIKITEEALVQCLLKECQKEKLSYKIVALKATGQILQATQIDRFRDLYELFSPVIRVSNEVAEEDEEEGKPSLELQEAVVRCLGNAWPKGRRETQQKFMLDLVRSLRVLVEATTRSNQLTIANSLGEIVRKWEVDEAFEVEVLAEMGKLLSVVLVVPKHGQLRTVSLKVLASVVDILTQQTNGQEAALEVFKEEIAKSLDYVIKDLGSDALSKDTARQIKKQLFVD